MKKVMIKLKDDKAEIDVAGLPMVDKMHIVSAMVREIYIHAVSIRMGEKFVKIAVDKGREEVEEERAKIDNP